MVSGCSIYSTQQMSIRVDECRTASVTELEIEHSTLREKNDLDRCSLTTDIFSEVTSHRKFFYFRSPNYLSLAPLSQTEKQVIL